MTIETLIAGFADRAAKEALVVNNATFSYGELFEEIEARSLSEIPAGSVVALIGDFNLQTVVDLFALWRRNCVVVPMR